MNSLRQNWADSCRAGQQAGMKSMFPLGRRQERYRPDKAARQLLVNLFSHNHWIRSRVDLNGRTVGLADIEAPVLDVCLRDDHITPPKTMQGLYGGVGSDVDSESGLASGCIGVFVNGKSQDVCGNGIVEQQHQQP